jgi:hypothetical protein
MRHYELPPEEKKQLISSEKAASLRYKLVYLGFILAVLGTLVLFLAFFFQSVLNNYGLPYREAQGAAIALVFIGWMMFSTFSRLLGIRTRGMTFKRMMTILRNEVEEPFNEEEAIRKQIGTSLSTISDDWALYPAVFSDDPKRRIPAIIIGPGGVFSLEVITQNHRRKGYIDPVPRLKAGTADLESRLNVKVRPIVGFLRSKHHYQHEDQDIRAYTLPELYAHIESREATLSKTDLVSAESTLRYLANLPASIQPLPPSRFLTKKA